MTFATMQTEVRDQLSVLTTSTFYTTTMIKRWLNAGKDWAMGQKKWPFLEHKGTDTVDGDNEYPYPTGMMTKSAFLVTVNEERFEKIKYEDYLKFKESNESDTDKIWAEYDRKIYLNANAVTIGHAIAIYGQKIVDDMSDDTDTTPFADAEPLGDQAIIKKALSLAMDKAPGGITKSRQLLAGAMVDVETVWNRIIEAMPREVCKNTPRFRKINILQGTTESADPNNVGRFNY